MSSTRPAADRASGRVVVDAVSHLADCIIPDITAAEKQSLMEYCMNILGSLVGAGSGKGGSGMGAYWAVGDRMERRLKALRRDDVEVSRFKMLRAELSTSQVVTRKT